MHADAPWPRLAISKKGFSDHELANRPRRSFSTWRLYTMYNRARPSPSLYARPRSWLPWPRIDCCTSISSRF